MPACTPERGNSTPTLRPDPCDLPILKGATVARMPAPRPPATLRRVTPQTLACVLRLMRVLLRCASVCLGLLKYTSFARRASCPPGRRAAAGQPRPPPPHRGLAAPGHVDVRYTGKALSDGCNLPRPGARGWPGYCQGARGAAPWRRGHRRSLPPPTGRLGTARR